MTHYSYPYGTEKEKIRKIPITRFSYSEENSKKKKNPTMDTVVDLQVQIYILAGLFGGVCIMLIFIMAALCGKVSKLKRQQRELQLSSVTANS